MWVVAVDSKSEVISCTCKALGFSAKDTNTIATELSSIVESSDVAMPPTSSPSAHPICSDSLMSSSRTYPKACNSHAQPRPSTTVIAITTIAPQSRARQIKSSFTIAVQPLQQAVT